MKNEQISHISTTLENLNIKCTQLIRKYHRFKITYASHAHTYTTNRKLFDDFSDDPCTDCLPSFSQREALSLLDRSLVQHGKLEVRIFTRHDKFFTLGKRDGCCNVQCTDKHLWGVVRHEWFVSATFVLVQNVHLESESQVNACASLFSLGSVIP